MIDIQVNLIAYDLVPDRGQAGAEARSPDAKTTINPEQGPMRGTLNELSADIEKLVWLPIQVDARMRTAIDIAV